MAADGSATNPSSEVQVTTLSAAIEFTGDLYPGSEGNDLSIGIARNGSTRGTASVRLRIMSGSAEPGSDFETVDRLVHFEDWQYYLRVDVPISRDRLLEGTETSTAVLSDVVGADLGSRTSAQLQIRDSVTGVGPTNLRVPRITDTEITLQWDDNCDNETSYVVERTYGPTIIGSKTTLPPGSTSWTDVGLLAGRTYAYRVYAVRGDLVSDVVYSDSIETAPGSGKVQVSTVSLSFGNVRVGSTKQLPITFTNTGSVPLTVVFEAARMPFILKGDFGTLVLSPSGSGRKATIKVGFRPTRKGTVAGELVVITTALGREAFRIRLTGKGT